MRLKSQVALITGAARGIGRDIALLFAREGAEVVIFDMQEEQGKQTVTEIESLGRKGLFLMVDVTSLESVEKAVNIVLDKFSHIDILVNNAGITRDNLLLRMSPQEWDAVLSVNLKGVFNCSRTVTRLMLKQKRGRIINIASIIGIIGNPGQTNYAASKAGIIAFTRSLAKEVASRGILVNAVAPGFIETEMTAKLPEDVKNRMLSQIPLARFGKPSDVARACLFLASEDADYITAQTIVVDGGLI